MHAAVEGDASPHEDWLGLVPVSIQRPSPRRDQSLYDSGCLSTHNMRKNENSGGDGTSTTSTITLDVPVIGKEEPKILGGGSGVEKETTKRDDWLEREAERISVRTKRGGGKRDGTMFNSLEVQLNEERVKAHEEILHPEGVESTIPSHTNEMNRMGREKEGANQQDNVKEGKYSGGDSVQTKEQREDKGKEKLKEAERGKEKSQTDPNGGRHLARLGYYQASSDDFLTRKGKDSRKKTVEGIARFRQHQQNKAKGIEDEDSDGSQGEDNDYECTEEDDQRHQLFGNTMSPLKEVISGVGSSKPGLDGEEIVKINVGGFRYTTTRSTLLGGGGRVRAENFFTALFSGRYPELQDQTGAYFIDRDGQYFAPILTYLRTGVASIPPGMPLEAVKREAEFFNIQPLVRAVERLMRDKEMATSDITKAEFFQCLTMARIKGFMLSMAGMKMRGIDFSHMQLLNVHFSSCDLEGANFTNAILNKAQFHAANLKNVKFVHSIFSSHTNPFSRTTNLEGVLFHQTDHALSLYGQSFREWGYKTENVSLSVYGISFKELGYQMENVTTEFFCKNIVRLVKKDEAELEKEREKEREKNDSDSVS